MSVFEEALTVLACPHGCAAPLSFETSRFACGGCGAHYPLRGSVVDFLPDAGPSAGRAQRVMENEWVAKIYEDYFRPWFTKLGSTVDYAEEERWLLGQLDARTPGPALDLACGTGRYARLLARTQSESLVIGADLSLPMLQEATARGAAQGLHNLLFVRADATRLPLRDASLRLLNCFGALHLFPSTAAALRELARVACDGAAFTCLTACLHERPRRARAQRAFSRWASFTFFEETELQDQLCSAGFADYRSTRHDSVLLFRALRGDRATPQAGRTAR